MEDCCDWISGGVWSSLSSRLLRDVYAWACARCSCRFFLTVRVEKESEGLLIDGSEDESGISWSIDVDTFLILGSLEDVPWKVSRRNLRSLLTTTL